MDNHAELGLEPSVHVTCPTCRTRYQQSPPSSVESPRYRCTRCQAVFVPAPGRASYRVTTPGATPAAIDRPVFVGPHGEAGDRRMAIGMDDPSLADRVRSTALDEISAGEDRAVWTYRVSSEDGVPGEDPAMPPHFAEDPHAGELLDEALHDAERAAPAGRPGVGGLVVALGLGAAGWAAGQYVAEPLLGDPMIWSGAGAVLGLLIGWMTIRWMARNR